MIRASLFLPPHYSRLVSHPGSFAAMNTAESYDGYMSIVPKHSKWENKMQSRGFLKLSMYNPLKNAAKVKAPTLVMAGRNDSLIPIDAVKKLSEKLPKSELVIVECNHFQPYQGEFFYEFAEKQAAFFRKHLL